MNLETFKKLQPGDVVRGDNGIGYIVHANYGERVIAVRTVDMTNPVEWELVRGDNGIGYIVHANYGERVIAVRTVDMTNPVEWELVEKKMDLDNEA